MTTLRFSASLYAEAAIAAAADAYAQLLRTSVAQEKSELAVTLIPLDGVELTDDVLDHFGNQVLHETITRRPRSGATGSQPVGSAGRAESPSLQHDGTPEIAADTLAYFRFGQLGERAILSNDAGEWHLMPQPEFDQFVRGQLPADHAQMPMLRAKGFLRDGFDADAFAEKFRRKKAFVGQGPHLHIVLTTLRCNQSCRYCHASRTSMDRVDTDMTMETAKAVVDLAMQTTSNYVNFEFQGGEPTVNFPVLQYIVDYSRERNRTLGKVLEHSVVTNLTHMTDEKADWLVDNKVMVCTSLDGPEELHNWNRTWSGGGNAWGDVVRWIRTLNERHIARGHDPRLWHVDALMTTTRRTFDHWKEIIDLYVDLGIRNIFFRPLNPYGFAVKSWKTIGYSVDEYLDLYMRALDYIIELNRRGIEIMEAGAAHFLVKLLTPDDPNFADIRSPAGAGSGVLAYNYDGRIFPSDEARMLWAMGDDIFELGRAGESTYEEIVTHPTVRSIALASLQDTLPACATCWNKPFCGMDPIDNYMVHGDLFGQRPLSPNCRESYNIVARLIEKLAADSTGEIEKIFRRWTVRRLRSGELEDMRSSA
ncbi:MAG TPA: His-Xaa-Ser system radical SAM maturase HxsB [Thermoanaerobaculia bacterium]|nr:His-Xaa-Ser system radical SAM maturase HxsB [Thermoanaerobaculia bacterium]